MTRIAAALVLLIVVAAGAAAALEQDFFGGRREPMPQADGNQPYDGKLTFVRLKYTMGFYGRRGWEPPWAHDYPTADTHVMKILNELSLVRPRMDGSNILGLDDPELFKYPIAYMSEPGFWSMDEDEVKGLRDYLSKGGFIMFDDFRGRDWDNLQDQMRLVFPQGQWVELDGTHPIFHSFFEINSLEVDSYYGRAEWLGIFEDNDPRKRLLAVANSNHDLGEYWEFSDTGYLPVDLSNEAYKFGVNYVVYGMTH
jgi:hypothetical protein